MFIQNAVLKSINAEGLSFPLAEGSVVSVGGVTGIVLTTLNVRPATNRIYVAVAGTIDLTSDANKGVTFTDEQIKAMGKDFNFVPAVETESKKELPTWNSLSNTGQTLVVNGANLTWGFPYQYPLLVNIGPAEGADPGVYAADRTLGDVDFTGPVIFRLTYDGATWQSTNYWFENGDSINAVVVKFDCLSSNGLTFVRVVWDYDGEEDSVAITEYETQISPVV